MAKIKKGDFIEIEYKGKIKGSDIVFDLTNEEEAKKLKIYNSKVKYGPIIICIGEGQILPGLDKELEGKLVEKDVKIVLTPEQAFGKKNPKLLKVLPIKYFKRDNINPMPGLQVNIDGSIGVVRSNTGGRVVVDFNHPLSGREIEYEVKILKKIDDTEAKIKGYLGLSFGINKYLFKDGKLTIELPQKIDNKLTKAFEDKIKKVISEIKDVEFIVK